MRLDAGDMIDLTEKRLLDQYSLRSHGRYINVSRTDSSGSSKVRSVLVAAWFMKMEGDYYESCRALRGRDRYAALRKKANALRWLTAWLNTFCDGTPM